MQGEISWCLSFIFAVFIDFLFSLNIYESLKKKCQPASAAPLGGDLAGVLGAWMQGDGGVSPVALLVKNPPDNAGDVKRCGFDPWVGKIP